MPSADSFLDEAPVKSADDFLDEGLVPSKTVPGWIQNELDAASEQQRMEANAAATVQPRDVGEVIRKGFNIPGKIAVANTNAMLGRGLHWPTDEEVEKPLINPEWIKKGIDAEAEDFLTKDDPDSKAVIPKIIAGAGEGVGNALLGFTSPSNLALLPLGGGARAAKLLGTVFAAKAATDAPEQWKAFNETQDPQEKARIAVETLTSFGLPLAAFLHQGPKTGEVPKSSEHQTATSEASRSVSESTLPPDYPESSQSLPDQPTQKESVPRRPSMNAEYEAMKAKLDELNKDQFLPDRPQPEPRPSVDEFLGEKEPSKSSPPLPTEEPLEPSVASTKNAVTDLERESRGIAPAVETAKRDFGTVWDEAEAHVKRDSTAPERLANEIAVNPRALTDKENALLLRRQIEVQNEHDAAIKAVNEATDEAGRIDATARLERARDALQVVYDAAKAAGTETGRGLSARRMLANDDYSLAKMEATTRAVVNDGKPLNPKQVAEVRALHERIAETEKRLRQYETREKLQGLSREAAKEARQRKQSGKTHQSFLEEKARAARERLAKQGPCLL